MRNLIILKGVSGNGKSTFANLVAEPKVICTADDYFTDANGNYNFDATKLGAAHGACKAKFDNSLNDDAIENIVIANTNTKPSEWKYYAEKAEQAGLRVIHIVLEKHHNNASIHNVPIETLNRQEASIRQHLKLQ